MKDLMVGISGTGRPHIPLTVLQAMSEMIEAPQRQSIPSKPKAASPHKKARRKRIQASRKVNRK